MEGEHEPEEPQDKDLKREAKTRLRQVDRAHGRLARSLGLNQPGDKYLLASELASANDQIAEEGGDTATAPATPQGKADDQA